MKIGIMTHYYDSLNYGGMLQAYALTEFLRKHGYEAEQISYRFSSKPFAEKPKAPAPVSGRKGLRGFFIRCRDSAHYRLVQKPRETYYADYKKTELPRRAEAFGAFQRSVPHSDRVYTMRDVTEAAAAYDCLITGSDQVWNFDWFNPAFFLDFPDCRAKRIAYAASAGKSAFSEAERAYLRRVLPAFQAISVRETDLADSLNGIPGMGPVSVAVDPTLLLSAEDWKSIASPRRVKENYLFCYYHHNDEELSRLARAFARKRRLRIVTIPFPGIEYNEADIRFGSLRYDAAGPADFLSLILHADYVFTDSFHASVFSLLFGKRFLAFPRGDARGMGSRLETLTALFGCPERFCRVPPSERLPYVLSTIESGPKTMNDGILRWKQTSEAFLLQTLGKD